MTKKNEIHGGDNTDIEDISESSSDESQDVCHTDYCLSQPELHGKSQEEKEQYVELQIRKKLYE